MYSILNRKGRFIYQLAMFCGLCIGSALTVGIVSLWLPALELDFNAQPEEVDGSLLCLLILGMSLSAGIGFFIGLSLVTLFLAIIKQLSFDEVVRLMFKNKFPNHWLK